MGKLCYCANQNDFSKIPGNTIAYWLSHKYIDLFDEKSINDCAIPKAGVVTGNDSYFVRFWFECKESDIIKYPTEAYGKYHYFHKGGSYRKWYGNYEYVIKLADFYDESKSNPSVRRGDKDFYFKKGIGWSQISGSAEKSFRIIENSICGTATPTIYTDSSIYEYVMALLNTHYSQILLNIYNPTINTLSTDICNIPFKLNEDYVESIRELVNGNICYAKTDWDSFETSLDFKKHPLI